MLAEGEKNNREQPGERKGQTKHQGKTIGGYLRNTEKVQPLQRRISKGNHDVKSLKKIKSSAMTSDARLTAL